MKMMVDTLGAINQGVLKYLSREEKATAAIVAAPGSVPDPYLQQGSHPDIVARVWDELGKALHPNCRCLVYGTPALVHERSGVVIAICNGTQYNLRLTEADFLEAIAKGVATWTRWSNGEEMDALAVLGPGWVFGGWLKDELQWCRNIHEEHGNHAVHAIGDSAPQP
jgi:hypothetical protein